MNLLLKEIPDSLVQENFRRVEIALRDEPLLKGKFKFFEITLAAAAYPASVNFMHNLGFVPRDILQTSLTGGTLAWNYATFTRTKLFATISAPVTVRAFIGTYAEGRT